MHLFLCCRAVLFLLYSSVVWTMAESYLVVLNLNLMERSFQKSLNFRW
jgi:hypothetical protein